MRIFITGATGFVGSHVAYRLLAAGHELVAIARNPAKLPELSEHPRVTRRTATLADAAIIRDALEGCDACVHVALGWGDAPLDMLKADTAATVSLLEACLDARVGRFVYTSSTAALGPFSRSMNESTPVLPSDYYGATKAASEAYVLAVGAKTSMRCNVIRPGYTFGNPVAPGGTTQPDRRFHGIAEWALGAGELELRAGDGTQFVWAGDLARLYEAVLASERNRELYFGLGARFVTWSSIAERARELAAGCGRIRLEGKPGEPCLFDLGKIREHFGLEFEPEPHIGDHLRYLIGERAARGSLSGRPA